MAAPARCWSPSPPVACSSSKLTRGARVRSRFYASRTVKPSCSSSSAELLGVSVTYENPVVAALGNSLPPAPTAASLPALLSQVPPDLLAQLREGRRSSTRSAHRALHGRDPETFARGRSAGLVAGQRLSLRRPVERAGIGLEERGIALYAEADDSSEHGEMNGRERSHQRPDRGRHADNLRLLTGILDQLGYEVRPAMSGAQALQAAEHAPPDLILLDVTMPEMDGYEVCRRLKANPKLKDIPWSS